MAGKADLVDTIVSDAALSRKDAAAALDSVIGAITGVLKKGGRVALPGFGSFSVADRKPRAGVNPRTRERIRIAGSRVARFRAGKELKELLNRKKK